jgi:hypothetical protein
MGPIVPTSKPEHHFYSVSELDLILALAEGAGISLQPPVA